MDWEKIKVVGPNYGPEGIVGSPTVILELPNGARVDTGISFEYLERLGSTQKGSDT